MEAANPNLPELEDVVEGSIASKVPEAQNDIPATKLSTVESAVEDDKSKEDEQAGTSSVAKAEETGAEKPSAKRNYRRRFGSSDDSSTDDDTRVLGPSLAVENPEEMEQPSSDSEDVSLDELHVSASDDQNNQNPRR